MNDRAIVELFLARDAAAIHETSKKYGAKLQGIAAGILADGHEAEECVNDAYLRAWNSIPPNEPWDYLFPYLARLTRQIALSRVKAASAMKRSAQLTELTDEMAQCIPASVSTEDEAEARELAGLINAFLASLPEQKRSVFLRRYWYFDSIADIAEAFRSSESKVKTMLFRIREKLKAYLQKEGYDV